jgi:hypothetical protein
VSTFGCHIHDTDIRWARAGAGSPGPKVLLSAPAEILAGRLASRTGNPYGKTPRELRRVFDDLRAVEPLLRKAADYEIRTAMPLSDVVMAVRRLIGA